MAQNDKHDVHSRQKPIIMINNYPKRIEINLENPQMRWINLAVEILHEDGIVVYPTDSTYGLGCDIHSKKATEKLLQLKKHDKHHLFSFIFSDLKDMSQYVRIDTPNFKILKRCLPGAYTFILEATREIPKIALTKRRTVGIRIPDNIIIQTLVSALGNPIRNTTVSTDDEEIINDPELIEKEFGHAVDLIFDGGILVSRPSTVVDLTCNPPEIIREGLGDISLVYG